MALNQFGNFLFIAIHGPNDVGSPPANVATHVEVLQRPGFDGTAIIDLGKKGKPFQMRSVVDTQTPADALIMADLYRKSQGQGPFGLIWNGVNFYTDFDVVYVPIEVDVTKIRRLRTATGGIYPPSLGLVECLWTLMPIEVKPPP